MNKCGIVVTNKRVTGKASFGKQVDLPLNQISAIGLGYFNSIAVATSSGKIHFWLLENRNEIHTALSEQIGKLQTETPVTNNNSSINTADELKKYKDLLDNNIITQEEFDAKKKELLNIQ
ncbi:MAG: SHOCT domain-containing protein [Acutalibacteraceae bacterium]